VKQTSRKWETDIRQKCGQTPLDEREVVSGNRSKLLGQTQFSWVKTTQCHQLHINFSWAAPWDMENDGWISGPETHKKGIGSILELQPLQHDK